MPFATDGRFPGYLCSVRLEFTSEGPTMPTNSYCGLLPTIEEERAYFETFDPRRFRAVPSGETLIDVKRRASFRRSTRIASFACKDNYNTADLSTTGGSASLAGMLPPADAFVVAKLRKAGAIILGKSNMHEFALAGTWWPDT
jgi:hypothetical protein